MKEIALLEIKLIIHSNTRKISEEIISEICKDFKNISEDIVSLIVYKTISKLTDRLGE